MEQEQQLQEALRQHQEEEVIRQRQEELLEQAALEEAIDSIRRKMPPTQSLIILPSDSVQRQKIIL